MFKLGMRRENRVENMGLDSFEKEQTILVGREVDYGGELGVSIRRSKPTHDKQTCPQNVKKITFLKLNV